MLDLAELLRGLASNNEPACLAIVVAGKRPGVKAVYDASGARRGGDAAFSDALEKEIGKRAVKAIASGEASLHDLTDDACGASFKVYLEPQRGSAELLLLGHGPVASALERVARASGFNVRAVARDFARLERPGERTHAVVTTGHEADEEALAAVLSGSPASVQLVASSRRVPIVFDALRGMGVSEEKLALVRAPAGLDLGGSSPDEIAVSIVAEILAVRGGGSGRPLSEVKGTRAKKDGAAAPRSSAADGVVDLRRTVPPARSREDNRVHKVTLEDSDQFKLPTRHDEDFRPDDDEAPAPRKGKAKKRGAR
jgi:xanthine dehydrogenase accessory factor